MVETWVYDLHYVFEQTMLVAAVLLVGAKFFETRTVFSIGFDRVDAQKMTVKGPDENNVWVGHRYNSAIEAEAIAAALNERINASTEPQSEQ
jgi:CO dehydrogenase/acetyl-CoA synthase beta subunit